jgi:flagellar biosynthetic protein FliO
MKNVAKHQSKIPALLLIVALCSSLSVPAWAKSPTEVAEQVSSDSGQAGSPFLNDPNPDPATGTTDGTAGQELFLKMMLSVVLVVVLGVVAIYVSKKLLPRMTGASGKEIRVLETAYLGPRKAVHLVEIANRRLVIGSTNENITALADVTGQTKIKIQK